MSSIVEQIACWAGKQRQKPAVLFLEDGDTVSDRVTYGELDRRARTFAARLRAAGAAGDRVVLLLPSGIDYVVAFLGCLHARAVAVPLYPATSSLHAERAVHVLQDSGATCLVTTRRLLPLMQARLGTVNATWLAVDECRAAGTSFDPTTIGAEDPAFLQYTSGSTMHPRGVMVTHGNLMQHSLRLQERWQQGPGDVFVTWLPLFHDMGLIGMMLHPLFLGSTVVMMPATAFVQRPARWLEAISNYRATCTFAPNFAYELCVTQVKDEVLDQLDLASLACAGNGAEKVQVKTLEQFAQRFGRCGFRRSALRPSYGLAESTLVVTTGGRERVPSVRNFCAESMERGRLVEQAGGRGLALAGNGRPLSSLNVLVVDPATCLPCAPGEVGEVWIQGALVASGYWRQPEQTAATFAARLSSGEGPFLRTGDMGALVDGELYVAGRMKDVIVLLGQNHDPADIEYTATSAHPALSPGHGAAFAVEIDGRERVVLALELRRTARKQVDRDEVCAAVREAVEARHGVVPHAVVLLDPATLPMTSSGKIQRGACRRMLCERGLVPGLESPMPYGEKDLSAHAGAPSEPSEDLSKWIAHWVAQARQVPVEDVHGDAALASYGVSSLDLARLTAELGDKLGAPVAPSVLFESGSIRRLAQSLSDRQRGKQAQRRSARTAEWDEDRVAVIGMACRFPQAAGLDAFWELLTAGRVASKPAGEARADLLGALDGVADPAARWAGLLDDVDCFDAAFFGISPREAQCMDPQQRLLLQTAWHAIEHAGLTAEGLAGSPTGVFVGISADDYKQLLLRHGLGADMYAGTGTALSVAANRLSYWLDLRGPSWAVDTACSSSLVAVHNARTSLLSGETDLALAGTVNLILAPETSQAFARAGMLAEDGRCKTFDAAANGYVRGEGCAVVVLKRLADARRDGDNVLAVLAGSAVTHAGRTNGLTAPSREAHRAAVRRALDAADLRADEVSYVEAHGTGTPLGDPIEIEALAQAYAGQPRRFGPLQVASVKTSIGHLEAAAGLAGFIKVVLMLQRGLIPAHLQLRQVNPQVQAVAGGIEFPAQCREWNLPGSARRWAGVSSLGFGGSNAHVILGEPAQAAAASPVFEWPRVLTVSARTPSALRRLAQRYGEHMLRCADDTEAAAVCVSALHGRDHHGHRLAAVADSAHQLADALRARAQAYALDAQAGPRDGAGGKVAFIFTGQGAHDDRMATGLYRCCPDFSAFVRQCADLLQGIAPEIDLLAHFEARAGGERTPHDAQATQPLSFVIQAGLARLWMSAGAQPDGVMGEGLGEYAAAYVAGMLDLGTALRLVVHRARLATATHGAVHEAPDDISAIAAVMASAERAAPRCTVVSTLSGRVADDGFARPHYWAEHLRQPVRLHEALQTLAGLGFRRFIEIGPHPVLSALGRQAQPDALWLHSLRRDADDERQLLENMARWYELGGTLTRCGLRGDEPVQQARRLASSLPLYPFEGERHWMAAPAPVAAPQMRAQTAAADDLHVEVPLPEMPAWLRDHRVCGRGTMPGVGYLALAADAAAQCGVLAPGCVYAWREVMFSRPLSLEGDASRVRTSLRRDLSVAGGWRVEIHALDAASATWLLHAEALLLVSADPPAWTVEDFPTADLQTRADHVGGFYDTCATWGLQYGPAFRAIQEFGVRGPWAVAKLARVRAPAGDTSTMSSVALLDGMLQAGLAFLQQNEKPRSGTPLPAGIERVTLGPTLSRVVSVRARLRARTAERASIDVVAHAENGEIVALFEGVTVSWAATVWPRASLDAPAAHAVELYLPAWKDEAGQVEAATVQPRPESTVLIVYSPQAELWSRAIAARHSCGRRVEVCLARSTRRRGAGGWDVDVGDPYVWADVVSSVGAIDEVCFLGGLVDAADRLEPAFIASAQESGVVALFRLLKAVAGAGHGMRPVGVKVVTHGTQAVLANDEIHPAAASIAGFLKSLARELVAWRICHVDLSEDALRLGANEMHSLAQAVLQESRPLVALRQGRGFVPALRPLQAPPRQVAWRSGGAYVIVGGAGGLGLALACRLASRMPVRLVLVGRSTAGAELDQALQGIRALGSEVHYLQGDVTCAVSLHRAFSAARRLLGPLHGVVHSAFVMKDAVFESMSEQALRDVLAPKVQGSVNLLREVADDGLDILLTFSSLNALYGNAGQANYAGASSCQDALLLAAARRARFPVLTVNWGAWAEVGAAADSSHRQAVSRQGIIPIGSEEGFDALDAAMAAGTPQVIAVKATTELKASMNVDAPALQPACTAVSGQAPPQANAALRPAADPAQVERERRAYSGPAPAEVVRMDREGARRVLKDWLVTHVADVLRLTPPQEASLLATWDETRLSLLGMDSLTAVELRNQALADWSVDVPLGWLIGGATGAELTQALHEQLVLRHLANGLAGGDATGEGAAADDAECETWTL